MYPQVTSAYPAKGITIASVSYLFERFSYYGLRSILLLYMISNLGMDKGDATMYYGLFIGLSYLSALVGGVAGDLLMRPAIAVIIGGALEALGCFCIAVPHKIALIAGMLLIGIGTGFFKTNVFSQIAVLYKERLRVSDAGFSIVYFAINVGALAAPLVIATIADRDATIHPIGFVIAGIAALAAIIPWILDIKDMNLASQQKNAIPAEPLTTHAVLGLLSIIFLLPLFWSIYGAVGSSFSACDGYGRVSQALIVIIFPALSAVLWSFIKFDSLYKISIGFLLLLVPVAICAFISPCYKEMPLLFGLTEMMTVIPAYSIIARFAPRKLTGLFFGITFGMTYLANKLAAVFEQLMQKDMLSTSTLLFSSTLIAAGIFLVLAITLPKELRTS